MTQKIYNTLYGAIVADALGVPFEFKDRTFLKKNSVKDMTGYGTYNLPKGTWSDDSSMTLCLAESIARLGRIDCNDIMKNFVLWFKKAEFTSDHEVFDIGCTCQTAVFSFIRGKAGVACGLCDEMSNGNGSLMRISPLPLYLFQKLGPEAMDKEEAFELIGNVSRLTHGHAISLIGCDIYCALMIEILKGTKKEDLLKAASAKISLFVKNHPEYKAAFDKYGRIFHDSFKDLPEDEISSSGYVVDTLEAALWCFLNTENYHDCVLKAVNLGRDTDTVACVAGSIAGLYYGDIPGEWISTIRNKELVDKVIGDFTNAICV